MREIITLQIGNCGNSVGQKFWESICTEHGIDESGRYVGDSGLQLENIGVYFTELKDLMYIPKSVIIDLDRRSINAVKSSPYGNIFNADNCVFGVEGAGSNWAKGHFTEGVELCSNALETVRKESEACDCLCEFGTIHSVGGGTGAGLGSLLICKLNDEYPKKLITACSIIPSSNISNCVVEPYNAVLTANYLIDYTHKTFCMENDALYAIAENLDLTQADFCGVNSLISCAMSGITTCVRFPGPSDLGFRKFVVNAIPFPKLHFFVTGLGPIANREKTSQEYAIKDVIASAFHHNNYLAVCDTRKGTVFTASCIFRGKLPAKEVVKRMSSAKNKNSPHFVEWIPNNLKVAFCDIAPPDFSPMTTFIVNTTAIQDVFKRLRAKYLKMFKKRMFLHWFTGEGMDECDFEEAHENVHELIEAYKSQEEKPNNPG